MYARYDAIVAQDEAEERAREEASRGTEALDEDAKRRFLASLPSHMRSDPHILRSLDSSESFRAFSREMFGAGSGGAAAALRSGAAAGGRVKTDLRMTRADVEKWARGEDEDVADLIPNPPSTRTTTPISPTVPVPSSLSSATFAKASAYKVKGNKRFKAGKLVKAAASYSAGIALIEQSDSTTASGNGDWSNINLTDLWTALMSNRAACQLQLGQYEQCAQGCGMILDTCSPRHVKALWRRSQARLAMHDTSGAEKDLRSLLAVEPDNAKALSALANLRGPNEDAAAGREKEEEKKTRTKTKKPKAKRKNKTQTLSAATMTTSSATRRLHAESAVFENHCTNLMQQIKSNPEGTNLQHAVDTFADQIMEACRDPQWQTLIAPFYTLALDDTLLQTCAAATDDVNGVSSSDNADVADVDTSRVLPKMSILIGASISRVFNALFARLLDSMDDPVSGGNLHFFGGTMLSARSSLRALIRTSMSGNKIQLEKMRVHLCAQMAAVDVSDGFFGDRAWMWVANADRELCSRIRSKDLQGALFHAFEGELLRHVAKGPVAMAEFFKRAELKGGVQDALGGPVQARIRQFSVVMLGHEHLLA